MTSDIRIVRSDPALEDLLASGYRIVAESWGARLRLDDPPALAVQAGAVANAVAVGGVVAELHAGDAAAIAAVEKATNADYPVTPATTQPLRTEDELRSLVAAGRAFGVRLQSRLVAVTVLSRIGPTVAETEFTSVLALARRRGFGTAAKAATILALAHEGVRTFGTGGAQVNAASIRMNESLGYVIEERWLSLRPAC